MDLNDLLADPRVVWTEDVLRFGDTDANGHINNALFATLCESGRVNLFRTRFDPTLPENGSSSSPASASISAPS